MTTTKDMTPVEIDTALAALYQHLYTAQDRQALWNDSVETAYRNMSRSYRSRPSVAEVQEALSQVLAGELTGYYADRMREAHERVNGFQQEIDNLKGQIMDYEDEYRARGGWTRAFLVTNGNGHVHSSMACSTCFPTTRYHWVTSLSDHDETEVVEAAGERACTVCYPSAPVEVLNRPTTLFTPDEEEKQRARAEREQRKAEREASMITLMVFQKDRRTKATVLRDVTWKTTRALQNDAGALVRNMHGSWAIVNGFEIPDDHDDQQRSLDDMLAALRERGVDTDALVAKNIKRAEKER